MASITHSFVSVVADPSDPDLVGSTAWNDDHDISGTLAVANGGTGAADAPTALANLGVTTNGAWTTFTPAFGGWNIGSSTATGAWKMLGDKTMAIRVRLVITTGGSFSTSADLKVTLPNSAAVAGTTQCLSAAYRDAGSRAWVGTLAFDGTDSNTSGRFFQTESGGSGFVNGNNPITWANGDTIDASGVLEIA